MTTSGDDGGKSGNGNGAGGRAVEDPFASGVWLLAMMGGRDVLARVAQEDQTEAMLRAEMIEYRSICVRLMPRYILSQVQFPMPTGRDRAGNPTQFVPASLAAVGKHETNLELEHDFPVDCCLHAFTFLSDVHPNDVERLRRTVRNAEEAAEASARMMRSNLVAPATGGVAAR